MSNKVKGWFFGGLTLVLFVLFLVVIGRPLQEIAAVLIALGILASACATLYYMLDHIS
jgi:hypothetical protein